MFDEPGTDHPVDAFRVHEVPPRGALRFESVGTGNESWGRAMSFDRSHGVEIGVLDGQWELEFGEIGDLVLEPTRQQLIVLERMSHELRSFDAAGNPIATAGGRGSGPGEFLRPQSVLLLAPRELRVIELSGTASTFEFEGDSLRFAYKTRLARETVDACVLNETTYVHGRDGAGGSLIRSFSADGDQVASFAEAYRSPNPLLRHQLSRGRIACLGQPGMILFAPSLLPEVHAYAADGRFLWWWSIAGWLPVDLREVRGGSRMSTPNEGYHAIVNLAASRDEPAALIQIAHFTLDPVLDRPTAQTLHTFVLWVDRAQAGYLGTEWGVVREWGSNFAVVTEEHPFPRVFWFRRE
jgi:hypothetical protein